MINFEIKLFHEIMIPMILPFITAVLTLQIITSWKGGGK
jgi:ABC-type glycerol-3-phosphate transport system permease component